GCGYRCRCSITIKTWTKWCRRFLKGAEVQRAGCRVQGAPCMVRRCTVHAAPKAPCPPAPLHPAPLPPLYLSYIFPYPRYCFTASRGYEIFTDVTLPFASSCASSCVLTPAQYVGRLSFLKRSTT